jgi:anthraniloyl-CoA monooxygenase
MDASDMAAVTSAFAEAAGRAALAGADVVAVDAAHGHLLASFLSPLSNLREDEYGGSLENRLRFPLEVIAEVRDSWPADLTLAVRLTVDDWRGDETNRGIDIGEGVAMATVMREAGVQLIHVEAGQSVANDRPQYRRRFLTTLADRVHSEAGVTTLVGGYLTTLDDVNTIVAAGRADLCLLEAQR